MISSDFRDVSSDWRAECYLEEEEEAALSAGDSGDEDRPFPAPPSPSEIFNSTRPTLP